MWLNYITQEGIDALSICEQRACSDFLFIYSEDLYSAPSIIGINTWGFEGSCNRQILGLGPWGIVGSPWNIIVSFFFGRDWAGTPLSSSVLKMRYISLQNEWINAIMYRGYEIRTLSKPVTFQK